MTAEQLPRQRVSLTFYSTDQGEVDMSVEMTRPLTLGEQVEMTTALLHKVCGILGGDVGAIRVERCPHDRALLVGVLSSGVPFSWCGRCGAIRHGEDEDGQLWLNPSRMFP